MRIPKKITWEFLYKYAYGSKKEVEENIIFCQKDNYYLGFNPKGNIKLFQHTNWSENIIIIRKDASYEEMFDIMQQLKKSLKDKYYNLKKAHICNCENSKIRVRAIKK